MFAGFRRELTGYPSQFWLMFAGMILSTIGTTIIWPFLMIYASEILSLPLATVASLMTVSATAGLISLILAGPVVDWVGRKWIMVILTLGELAVVSLSSAYAANLAPIDKRGPFMSLYGLTWNVASGISPVAGGFLSDWFNPQAPWWAGVGLGAAALGAFWWMNRRWQS